MNEEPSTRGAVAPFSPGGLCAGLTMQLAIGVALLCLYLIASNGAPVCFDDCYGYIGLMGKSGNDYLATMVGEFRPWAVPMFFSLFGHYSPESASHIVLAQTIVAFVAWCLFAGTTCRLLRLPALRGPSFLVLALLMFGQGYFYFNRYLLSDSLALSSALLQWSLILAFPAFVAWARRTQRRPCVIELYLAAILGVSAFEMATRDANLMMALAGGGAFLLIARPEASFGDKARERLALFAFILLLGSLAYLQSFGAQHRHQLNAENIMAGAVIPNAEVRNYFAENGMPARLQALGDVAAPQDLANIDLTELKRIGRLMTADARGDADTRAFLDKARGLYIRFLVTHPGYILTHAWRNWRLIFAFRFPASPSEWGNDISVADYFPSAVGVALFLGCFILPSLRRDRFAWLPLTFAAVGAANALLAFLGDVWERSEMTRHAAIGSVTLRCGLALCALMLLEEAARRSTSASRRLQAPAEGFARFFTGAKDGAAWVRRDV